MIIHHWWKGQRVVKEDCKNSNEERLVVIAFERNESAGIRCMGQEHQWINWIRLQEITDHVNEQCLETFDFKTWQYTADKIINKNKASALTIRLAY